MAYYKKIKGRNYDGKILKTADGAVKTKRDGRISLSDAKNILKIVKDSADYTDVEKNTMQYVRDNYKFTSEADKWFRTEIRKWAAKKAPITKKPAAKVKASPKKKPVPSMIDIAEKEILQAAQSHRPIEEKTGQSGKKSGGGRIFIALLILAVVILTAFFFKPLKNLFIKSEPTETKSGELKPADVIKPVKPEAEVPVVVEPSVPEKNMYIVQVKDSIIGISEKLTGDYRNWKKIYDANANIIKSPVLIYPGQKLRIPEDLNLKK